MALFGGIFGTIFTTISCQNVQKTPLKRTCKHGEERLFFSQIRPKNLKKESKTGAMTITIGQHAASATTGDNDNNNNNNRDACTIPLVRWKGIWCCCYILIVNYSCLCKLIMTEVWQVANRRKRWFLPLALISPKDWKVIGGGATPVLMDDKTKPWRGDR